MIERKDRIRELKTALGRSRVVVLVGPRQCGKTTLARQFIDENSINYFDLEDPASLARLEEPMTALRPLRGLVVIDEVQRRPELFRILRVLADRPEKPANFLILGSASGDLLRQSSESLAGRAERMTLGGFSLREIARADGQDLWLRGGLPLSLLAQNERDSYDWRKQFVQTLLERDFPQWGVRTSATALRRFWAMIAHRHGKTWNAADMARALAVGENTSRRYLDLLTDALMIRQLQPFFANIKKRQVKAPKIYIRDTGILHHLLGIKDMKGLLEHPIAGFSWEGFVIEQLLAESSHDEAFFWGTHQNAEIDLVVKRDSELFGIEVKRTDAPKITPSIRHALEDIGLRKVSIVYPGPKRYPLGERVEAVPLMDFANGFPAY